MLPIFGFKIFGNPGMKLFRVSPLGQTLIHDFNANYTTGSFYDANTFLPNYAVQFGKYIYNLLPDTLYRYDTISGTNTAFRAATGFVFQNIYEHSGGIFLSFDGTEWYLTFIYVNNTNQWRAERYRFSNRTWTTSGAFGNVGDNIQPQFKYFFNNSVFWFCNGLCHRFDTLSQAYSTVGGFTGDHRATSMAMHNNNIYLASTTTTTTVVIYIFVGGAWNIVQTVSGLTSASTASPNRLFSDGTNMYLLVYTNQASVGWRCFQIDGSSPTPPEVSTSVLPSFLRQSGLTTSVFKGFHVDSHTNPASPEIWLTYTAAWNTAGSSLAWYRWMGPATQMQYGGDAGEGGQDYSVAYDWTGGGHYAWTPGEPYAVMEGAPTAVAGSKTRIYFRIYESNLLALNAPVQVQLHYSTDLEPPRNLATISNPELVEQPETFSTAGNFNWTCPAGVTSVTAECWGAGGGGNVAAPNAPGGAGGGAYSRSAITVVPATVYPLTVGAGVAGAAGQDSYFIDTLTVLAKGGSPSNGALNAGQPGGQSSAGVGTLKFSGGTGGNGANASHNGGGGAAAHRTGNGGTGGVLGNGIGAAAVYPGGAGGNQLQNGGAPGGGAGGGALTTGGAGMVILTYSVPGQGSEVDVNTIQVVAGEDRLWSLDWHHGTDGIPPGARVSLAVRAIGV